MVTALPPRGNPSGLMVSGAPTVSSAKPRMVRVAAGEETLARRQVVDDHGRTGIGAPFSSVGCASRGNPSARPSAARVANTIATTRRHLSEPESLQVGLQEADLPAQRPRRQAALRAQERAPVRIEHVVARVAGDGAREQ